MALQTCGLWTAWPARALSYKGVGGTPFFKDFVHLKAIVRVKAKLHLKAIVRVKAKLHLKAIVRVKARLFGR